MRILFGRSPRPSTPPRLGASASDPHDRFRGSAREGGCSSPIRRGSATRAAPAVPNLRAPPERPEPRRPCGWVALP